MFHYYLKFAWRNLRNSFGYSFINIAGLALGIGSVLLIFLYVQHELSFDTYHEKGDRIWRITSYGGFNEKSWRSGSPGDPVPEFRTSHTAVEDGVRMISCSGGDVTAGGEDYADLSTYCTESNLFNIFTFPIISGPAEGLLDEPYTAVISQSTAERMFGEERAVGEFIDLNWEGGKRSFQITGVMEDIPVNTHFNHDIFLSFESMKETRRCLDCGGLAMYLLLEEEADTSGLADQILHHIREIDGKTYVDQAELQALADIHFSSLHAPRKGDFRYIQILSAIALVILVIGCSNYVNLAIARYTRRATEIGVRKVLGAHRMQLARQFLLETVLLTVIALPFALLLVHLAVPWFNVYADTEISGFLTGNGWFYAAALGVLVLTGLVAGSYPALVLSAFQPREVLQGRRGLRLSAGGFRKGLITFQFLATLVMIGITGVILQQLAYVQDKNLGFESDQVVTVRLTDPALRSSVDMVKQEFLRMASVTAVTATPAPATPGFAGVRLTFEADSATGEKLTFTTPRIDADFIETMDIALLAGENISEERDEENPFPDDALINETGVRILGYQNYDDILGEVIASRYRITGVVEDFHLESLQNEITPAFLERNPFNPYSINVRLAGGSIREGLEDLRTAWTNTGAVTPLDYTFVDDLIQQQYEQEQKTAKVIGMFATLSIIIACLGLFGLAAFTAQQRMKEIGIRKVMGASVPDIMLLLYREFGVLIGIATVLSVPVIYYGANRWLENFAYRIDFSPLIILLALLAVVTVTLISTGARSLQAALMNPVDSIRSE